MNIEQIQTEKRIAEDAIAAILTALQERTGSQVVYIRANSARFNYSDGHIEQFPCHVHVDLLP